MSTAESNNSAVNESLTAINLQASLTVRDVSASVAWYRDALGFKVDQQHEREGRIIAVSISAGPVRLLLGQDNGAKGTERVKGAGFSLQITTAQNIDAIAERVKQHGATLDAEPADMPSGVRFFRVTDPDGFKFTISSERHPS